MMRMLYLCAVMHVVCGLIEPAPASAQLQTAFVDPSDTDPAIDAWTESHYVAINPSATARNELFVFLPGTGGVPRHYRFLTEHAAHLGYHAVGLRYPNDDAVNILCAGQADLACHGHVRHEILDGMDRTDLVAVDPTNAIENRLHKLVDYLHTTRPGEGWDRFLGADGQIRWERVTVAGHSQGGGHAGYIGSVHRVARVVSFAAADYHAALDRSAAWLDADHATPPGAYFGFGHTRDLLVLEPRMLDNWRRLGMDAFGPPVNVDTLTAPFAGSHQLLTSVMPRLGGLGGTHGSVAVDLRTPLDPDGTPVLAPVWTYLLTAETTATSTAPPPSFDAFRLEPGYPNPTASTARFRFVLPRAEAATLTVHDLLGREVKTVRAASQAAGTHEVILDVDGWPAGLYFVRLTAGGQRATQQLFVTN